MTVALAPSRFVALYNAGLSHDRIADELEMSRRAVSRAVADLRASGDIDDRTLVRVVWSERLLGRLRHYAAQGFSAPKISTIIGIGHPSVLAKLRELAESGDASVAAAIAPSSPKWPAEKVAAFRGLWISGVDTAAIAERYGVTLGAVRKRADSMFRAGDLRMTPRGGGGIRPAVVRRRAVEAPVFPTTPVPAFAALPGSRRIGIAELREGDCRWLDDEDLYCGLPVGRGSYCGCHALRVYMPKK